MIEVREPTLADLKLANKDIRDADRREWYAGTGMRFRRASIKAIKGGGIKRVALEDGVPLCFWGCDGGVAWMFVSNAAYRKATTLHRILHKHLDELHEAYGPINAYADARNVVHHRWMEWLGMERRETYLLGPFRMPFIHFYKEK
jgi:hypothetical protein